MTGDADCDVIGIFDAVLFPAMILLFELPFPQFMIPGIDGYFKGIEKLDAVIAKIIAVSDLT
jgi:hypothetical protein